MAKLEELTPNAQVRGIRPDQLVTVVSVQWHGVTSVNYNSSELLKRAENPS